MENNHTVVDSSGSPLVVNRRYSVTIAPTLDIRARPMYAATTGADGSIFTVLEIQSNYRGNQMAVCKLGTNPPITMSNETFVFTPATGGKRSKRKKLIRKRHNTLKNVFRRARTRF